MKLVIGDKNLSSWSLRPWVLMRHAEIPFEEDLRPFETPGWREAVRATSPSGRVPALVLAPAEGGVTIWDSLAIAEHLAEAFPDRRLWPDERAARAIARAVSAEMHSGFADLRRDLSMDVTARVPTRAFAKQTSEDVARVIAIWSDCRARFGGARSGEPFLFGRFSIADAMFAPVVWRFRTYGVAIPDARARAYQETMLELPAMKEWERGAEREPRTGRSSADAPRPSSASSVARLASASGAAKLHAVVFSSQRALGRHDDGYDAAARAMVELAAKQPGFAGVESARGPDGFGITVSYWDSLEAIRAFRDLAEHRAVQARGRESFYERYAIRVCSVERAYEWKR